MFDWNQKARSNVQDISGIFQKLLRKSAVAHEKNIQLNIHLYAAVCYVFVPFSMEYSKNILQVRPLPKALSMCFLNFAFSAKF